MLMQELWIESWFIRTSLAGGALLALGAGLTLLIQQPARRQRLVELTLCSSVAVALLAWFPAWWQFDVSPWVDAMKLPRDHEPVPATTVVETMEVADANEFLAMVVDPSEPEPEKTIGGDWLQETPMLAIEDSGMVEGMAASAPAMPSQGADWALLPTASSAAVSWWQWGVLAYAFMVSFMLARCFAGYLALARLQRYTVRPPRHAVKLLRSLLGPAQRMPRLGVCTAIPSPISFGLLQPTILLPASFCQPGQEETLKSVLIHELSHLQRKDAWSCLLAAVSHAIYFYQPLIWWLRRQLRLSQEYLADAAAAQVMPAVDYAQCLLDWSVRCGRPSLASRRANGIFQWRSDLTRRIEMLLQAKQPWEAQCPRIWNVLLAGTFIGLGTLLSGVSLYAQPTTVEAAPAIHAGQADEERTATGSATKDEMHEFFAVAGQANVALDALHALFIQGPSDDEASKEKWQRELQRIRESLEQLKKHSDEATQARLEAAMRQLETLQKRGRDATVQDKEKLQAELEKRQKELAVQREEMVKRYQKFAESAQIKAQKLREQADLNLQKAEEQLKRTKETLEQLKKQLGDDATEEMETLRKRLLERAEKARKEALEQSEKAKQEAMKLMTEWQKEWKELPKDVEKEMKELARQQQELARKFAPTVPQPPRGGVFQVQPSPMFYQGQRSMMMARLGVVVEVVPESVWSQLNWEAPMGLLVAQVIPESAAAKAGLKKHDILLKIDGQDVESKLEALPKLMQSLPAKKPMDIVVLRKGKKTVIANVELGEMTAPSAMTPLIKTRPPVVTSPVVPMPPQKGIVTTPGKKDTTTHTVTIPGKKDTTTHSLTIHQGDPAGKKGSTTHTFLITNDGQFKATWQEGDLTIVVSGVSDDEKAKATSIQIKEGSSSKTYKSLDEVDESHRDKVKKLIDMARTKTVKVGDDD